MDLTKQNILFITRTMGLGGTETVVLQLCAIFKPMVNNIVVCSCGGENVKRLEKMGIRHYTIPDIEYKSPLAMLKIAYRLCSIVYNERITVIHTHHRMAAFYVAILGLYKKCVFINTSHNTFHNKKNFTAFSYKHASVIACGDMVKKNLVDYFGLSNQKVTVIRNAVAPFNGEIIKDEIIEKLRSEGCFVVGNIGRLTEQKGMEYYIEALPEILNNNTKVHFLVIGIGELEQKLRDLAKQLQVDDHVHFLGYRNDIQNLISQIDLVVLSSLWEGLPLTPIEAFSVGRTVIATKVDGTVEILKNGENGYLIPRRSYRAIAEKTIDLLNHPDRRRNLEKCAYRTYEEGFSIDRFARDMIAYYEGAEKR